MDSAGLQITPAEAIEWREIDRLTPYVRNARKHSPSQIKQIAKSIERFGFTMPVLVDEAGGIIAGHGRVQAARSLGWAQVPVMIAHGWDEPKRRAYVIADNKLATNSEWDRELLADELEELRELDVELDLLGFAKFELNDLIGTPDTVDGNPPPPGDGAVTCPRCAHKFEVE